MCQQIVDFCNGSTKPLLFVGAFFSLSLAITIGYTGCTNQALFSSIDPVLAQTKSTGYYLQLAAALYLLAVAALSCQAAYYDQKYSVRTLAALSSVNCLVALAALLLVPSGSEVSAQFEGTLKQAKDKYNFNEPFPVATANDSEADSGDAVLRALSSNARNTAGNAQPEQKAGARAAAPAAAAAEEQRDLNPHDSTQIWDSLQARGCCGLLDAATTWNADKLPKSCCARNLVSGDEKSGFRCEKVDQKHEQGCLRLLANTSLSLYIVLVLVALVNSYLALISGISSYRTIHYNEASQSAYT